MEGEPLIMENYLYVQSKIMLHIRHTNGGQAGIVLFYSIHLLNLYLICFPKYLDISLVSNPRVVVLFYFIKQNNTKGSSRGTCLSKSEFMFYFPCSPLAPCITVTSKWFL